MGSPLGGIDSPPVASRPQVIQELLVKTHDAAADYATERGENALMKAAANGHWAPWTENP